MVKKLLMEGMSVDRKNGDSLKDVLPIHTLPKLPVPVPALLQLRFRGWGRTETN